MTAEPEATDDAIDLLLRSGLLDPAYYMEAASLAPEPDVVLGRHYLEIGERSGLAPNPLFDPAFYRGTYLAGSDASPVMDYIRQGHGPRSPHLMFDQPFYLATSGASIPPGMTPLAHYRQDGWELGCDPHPLFSVAYYFELYDDIRRLGREPMSHFLAFGWREGRSPCPLFDSAWYTSVYVDVGARKLNPLLHFVRYGAAEGRNPSKEFDVAWYRSWMEGDPDAARLPNALAHYLHVGRARGWPPLPVDVPLDPDGTVSRAVFDVWADGTLTAFITATARHGTLPIVLVAPEGPVTWADLPAWLAAPPATSPDPLLLILQPGDRVLPRAADALARALPPGAAPALLTMDAVCFEGDRARPLLLPGANRVHLRHAAAIPPFAATASFCRLHPPRADEALRSWFLRLLAAATAVDDTLLRHIPIPVVEVPPERGGLDAARSDVAAIVDLIEPDPQAIPRGPAVSVIICSKDRGHLLMQLLGALFRPGMQGVKEVLLVLNRPTNAFALAYHARLARFERVRIVQYDREYNFSDQCNEGAKQATGAFLLFLNDDVMPLGERWLAQMLAWFDDPRVAIVGPLLLNPDETVQHAGMYLGFNGVGGHLQRGVRLPRAGSDAGLVPANCSAVTGAVMLVRAEVFRVLNGFDYSLATYLQDVDLCLRVLRMGLEVVYAPTAVLFHMESVSAAATLHTPAVRAQRRREHARFQRRWKDAMELDRFHNLSWRIQDESLSTLAAARPARFTRMFDG